MIRRFGVRGLAVGAVLALVAVACGEDEPAITGSPPAEEIPAVSVGECVTEQGTRAPADPKGVDYKTQLREPGVLNVGSDNDFPPFESIPAGQKEPVGFDVDIYKEVAKRLGLTAKSTTTSFDGLFTQSIPRGQFDVGVSAITIKESRKQTVDFTIPYFRADLSLVVNAARTPEIKTIDDLAGKTIGTQTGTTGEDCAKALIAQGKGKGPQSFDTSVLMFDALAQGSIEAVVNDRPASEGFLEDRPDLKVVQVISTSEEYGFAVSKDKPDLRVAINGALEAMMGDGTYARIYEQSFETPPPFEVPLQ